MLFDRSGNRKYLTTAEWRSFLDAANLAEPFTRSFCWTLAHTGGRLSEVRALTPRHVDPADGTIRIECLKRRQKGIFRELPIDVDLLALLEVTHAIAAERADNTLMDAPIWPWCRTTAWSRVKSVMLKAGLSEYLCKPKALRHTFGIEGVANQNIPLGTMKKWLGHARLESTIVYTTPTGREERMLARRMWRPFKMEF
jgi:integrase/recombinase XerD